MATLTKPDFALPEPNQRKTNTTDAVWWLRCHLLRLESSSRDAGTYANKKGFHNKGKQVADYGQGNSRTDYSIRDAKNRSGPWWKEMSSAFDWTFTTAQRGDYKLIDRYTSRLMESALDDDDPRLDLCLYEFYGQADNDREVEGYDELHERNVTSDSSHLWHLHFSFLRSKVGDFWAMWALYTVLIGWSVEQWRASLPKDQQPATPKPPKPSTPAGLPQYKLGSRVLRYRDNNGKPLKARMKGTDVLFVQKYAGGEQIFGELDGIAGPKFESGVKRYQRIRGITVDGIVGKVTWRNMGVR